MRAAITQDVTLSSATERNKRKREDKKRLALKELKKRYDAKNGKWSADAILKEMAKETTWGSLRTLREYRRGIDIASIRTDESS